MIKAEKMGCYIIFADHNQKRPFLNPHQLLKKDLQIPPES
jgi:hypothetical protein